VPEQRRAAPPLLPRRSFLTIGVAATIGALAGPLRGELQALARTVLADGGYGPLGEPDDLGVSLPEGFSARLVGRAGDAVPGTTFVWPSAPDGGACFPAPSGFGHVYVANSEVPDRGGAVSAVEFDADGGIVGARTLLNGTSMNCAGGATPWGTWLSCEEVDPTGLVWECDPGGGRAIVRPALGRFRHEAVAVDAARRQLFLTEDHPEGRLYRFVPSNWPDLSAGALQAAHVDGDLVTWVDVDVSGPARAVTTTSFDGGEGVVVSASSLLFATKGDRRIWELDLATSRLSVFHDCLANPNTALTHVDNLAVHPVTGHLFVAEDGGDMDLCMLTRTAEAPIVTRVVRFVGHDGSEVTGPSFSPDGRFLYLSSQRGADGRGVTVQVSGPFVPWIASITDGATPRRGAVRVGNARQVGDPSPRP